MPRPATVPTDTRDRIVGVATRLLQEEGPGAVTTRGVAEAAGAQAPAIYRLFGDKDGLLDAVAEQVMATYVSTKAATVRAASADDVDPLEDLRAGWERHIDFGLANPTLFRLLNDPDRVRRSSAAAAGLELLASRVHRVAQTGRLRVGEQRAVGLLHAAGIGAVSALLATPVATRDAGLADQLYDAVLAQILTGAPRAPEAGHTSAAVALRAVAPALDVLSGAEQDLLAEWLDRVVGTPGPTSR